MPSVPDRSIGRAEAAFRAAFERLKANMPQRLPLGTPVSQNNVAREAGLDPSALKKARFPQLIEDIKVWVAAAPASLASSQRERDHVRRRKNRTLLERLRAAQQQRDNVAALLVQADAHILALSQENARLKALLPEDNVIHLEGRRVAD